MPVRSRSIDNWKVEGDKLVAELSEDRLDALISRATTRLARIDQQIVGLGTEKVNVQRRLDKLNVLKGELNP